MVIFPTYLRRNFSVVIDDVVLCLQILSTRKSFTLGKVTSPEHPLQGHTSISDSLEGLGVFINEVIDSK